VPGWEAWKVGEPRKTAIDERAAHLIDRSHDLPYRKFTELKRHRGRTCDFPRECPIGTVDESFAARRVGVPR
jgi:hypothetical protein